MLQEENRNCGCDCDNENDMMDHNDCGCQQMNDIQTRREMMEEIKSLNFSIIELGLYLDTHPDDQKALCLHNKYCKELDDVEEQYQKAFGPLTIKYPCNKWRWLEEPWPWERGNF